MSKKALLTLLALLAVAAGAALLLRNRSRAPTPGASGATLFPSLDLEKVEKVAVGFSGQTAVLERGAQGWIVASLFGYPADFPRLRQTLTELGELTAGAVVRGGTESPADFGLLTDATVVTLFGEADAALAAISLGRSRSGGGRYLRVGDGPVVLAKEDLGRFTAKSEDWIEQKVLSVDVPQAGEITVAFPESSYTVKLAGQNSFELKGLTQEEKLNSGSAARLARALQSLRCLTVADPAKSDAEFGLDQPSSYEMKTADGLAYTVLVGGECTGPAGRYARVSVAYARPPPPTKEEVEAALPPEEAVSPSDQTAAGEPTPSDRVEAAYAERMKAFEAASAEREQRAAELKARLSQWTFVIPANAAETLTLPREKLLVQAEPVKQ